MRKRLRGMRPIRALTAGYLLIILAGTLLLMLPASSRGRALPFFDALFTATSASCVTGLVLFDTATQFTLFGQIVLLALIQLGGLGFMTMATILFGLTGHRVTLAERMTLAESLGESRLQGVVRLGRSAVGVTLCIEALGAALLAIRFIPQMGFVEGLWNAVFHSVSAFCNAGFDLMGGGVSFTRYAGDALVCLTLMGLITLGGLGFAVILGVRARRLSLHQKIVLTMAASLTLAGGVLITALEANNPATLGGMGFFEKLLAGFFQSVTLRTAGFNTISQAGLRDGSKLVSIALMLAGGAPAGTAGGLKTTTVFALLLAVRAHVQGRRDIEIFGRRLAPDLLRRALCIAVIGVLSLLSCALVISLAEEGASGGEQGFLNQIFEATSALCTVGLSVGLTAEATTLTRMVLCAMMFAGRAGMLTLALTLAGGRAAEGVVRFPEEEILIG